MSRKSYLYVLPAILLATAAWAAGGPTTEPVATSPASPVLDSSADAWDQQLALRVQKQPHDAEARLEQQLLHFLRHEDTPQADEVSLLEPEDRELVTIVMDGLSSFRAVTARAEPTASITMAAKMRPMLELADRLRERGPLTVNNLALCSSVTQFGIYEPLESTALVAGRECPVIVYCEIDNLHPELGAKGTWETRLSFDVVLFTETAPSVSVWSKRRTPVLDRCRNRRRDFFIADRITLPAKLPVGKYLMKVSVTDEQANRIGEATTPILFVAK